MFKSSPKPLNKNWKIIVERQVYRKSLDHCASFSSVQVLQAVHLDSFVSYLSLNFCRLLWCVLLTKLDDLSPYKIIKCYSSGSYDLQLLKTGSVVKKNGYDLYLSPQTIQPIQLLESSDTIYGSLNKKMVSDPYETAHIQNYIPIQSWKNISAPAAATQLLLSSVSLVEPFPSVAQLNEEFDSWPESTNPFGTESEVVLTHKDSPIDDTAHIALDKKTPPPI